MRIANVWYRSRTRQAIGDLIDNDLVILSGVTLHYILDQIKEHEYCVENESDYRLDMANRKADYVESTRLPFGKSDMVRVKKGSVVRSTHPGYDSKVLTRAQNVTVNHVLKGINPQRDCPNGKEPTVVWAGTGGYWHEASIFDCELVKRG